MGGGAPCTRRWCGGGRRVGEASARSGRCCEVGGTGAGLPASVVRGRGGGAPSHGGGAGEVQQLDLLDDGVHRGRDVAVRLKQTATCNGNKTLYLLCPGANAVKRHRCEMRSSREMRIRKDGVGVGNLGHNRNVL